VDSARAQTGPLQDAALPRTLQRLACAHYDTFHAKSHVARAESFRRGIARQPTGTVGIGVTNYAALEISGPTVRIIDNDVRAIVHKLTRDKTGVKIDRLHASQGEIPLTQLLTA
jgi:hypothetical protein